MTYEVSELLEVGEAGSMIQASKEAFIDEVTGSLGPNAVALEEE